MAVSVFIQTLNEEINLQKCLDSLSFSDDIVVLDSLSTDGTEAIARKNGARFFQRPYDGRASNQNWAVENIKFKHPWVYYSDADEVVTPELADEILSVTSDSDCTDVLYRVRYKNFFMGKWIKYSSLYPTWVPRLFKPDKIRWERGANPIAIADGSEGRLKEHFLHYNFSKGVDAWVGKHNKYSSYEALETIQELKNGSIDWPGLFSADAVRRRQAIKKASFRMPMRHVLKFVYMYFFRLGFLDGFAGLVYCHLQSMYEYMICVKVYELKRNRTSKS